MKLIFFNELMRTFALFVFALVLATSLHAKKEPLAPVAPPTAPSPPSKMFVGAYGGYGDLSGTYGSDGTTPYGRLTFGADAWSWKRCGFGFEGGVQSGNTIRLEASSAVISAAGGLPIQATLKPFVDFLVSVKFQLSEVHPVNVFVKGGFAFRQLQLEDRTSTRDQIKKVNGEIQAGISYQLTPRGRISASYQAIISNGNSGIQLAPNNNILLNHIPTQQGALFGIEYSL